MSVGQRSDGRGSEQAVAYNGPPPHILGLGTALKLNIWGGFCMEETLGSIRPHRITIQDRKTAGITGVSDCVSFDENEVVLDTDMGLLTIRGKELHVNRLTLEKGEVDLDGTVESFAYSSNEALRRSGESLFARLFK